MNKIVKPFVEAYRVVDNFLPTDLALSLRQRVEAHFGDPFRDQPSTHMIWNYWHVPKLYNYLRTLPELVLGEQLASEFAHIFGEWARESLGLRVTSPYLSLYIHGCRQAQHNDSANGRFGFVYSLTKDDRLTTGGDTLIWHDDDYFGGGLIHPGSGSAFYDSIRPQFNRLIVFDDRMPHAVEMVEGSLDPTEGRIVLHGHVYEAGPLVRGGLSQEDIEKAATSMALEFSSDLGEALMLYHGIAVVHFSVNADGKVNRPGLLVDRVRKLRGDGAEASEVTTQLLNRVNQLSFPSAADPTEVWLPVAFGNRLAELR